MRLLTLPAPGRGKRARPVRALLLGTALAAIAPGMAMAATGACPWIVQPTEHEAVRSADAAYEIIFDGLGLNLGAFYGFSVASVDLAWRLTEERMLPDLERDARRLQPLETPLGKYYQLAPDSIAPHTIYLAVSKRPIDELERIGARIEPSMQFAISQLAMRTRGGSDQSGPLPHRSVPGFLIADASSEAMPELQICAYQVALR